MTLTRVCCALLLLPCAAPGAVIRGVAVERATGRVLSRTSVTLHWIDEGHDKTISMKTRSSGQFEFDSLKPGLYVLEGSRV